MFTQRKICEQIVRTGGGYVFTVKGNQPQIADAVRLYFADLPWGAELQTHTMVTCWKGRKEKRSIRMTADHHLLTYLTWPGLTHVWECTREITRGGRTITEVAIGICSFPKRLAHLATAEKLNQYVRGHLSIENGLHRARDVTFNEDTATIRKGKAAQVMAALKNLVISILHRGTVRSFKTAFRRFAAHPKELFRFLGLTEVSKTQVFV